jgi:hypothetical protein
MAATEQARATYFKTGIIEFEDGKPQVSLTPEIIAAFKEKED